MAKVIPFRPTEKAQQVIEAYMKQHSLNQSQAVNAIVESFQSEPKDSPDSSGQSSPFSYAGSPQVETLYKIYCPKDDTLNTLKEINQKCRFCYSKKRCIVHTTT